MELHYTGNKGLLQLTKIAFVSSRNFSPQSVMACYDWAKQ